ncbi:hypothetical protein [Streptomyces sp. NBC_01320]|uniref:hypothetical protein n=1 Tax=Streptomyces sp. NBC_01320 TaxID=2903824 RepID=UPI002E0EB5DB|nr:hypothetical protein OG395_41420 [Streptomyces sp. NBC_01320]
MIVSDMMSTARTADVRTGSGMRRRTAGSSTHSGCRGIRVPPPVGAPVLRRSSVSKDFQLPTNVRLQGCCPACGVSTQADRIALPYALSVIPYPVPTLVQTDE